MKLHLSISLVLSVLSFAGLSQDTLKMVEPIWSIPIGSNSLYDHEPSYTFQLLTDSVEKNFSEFNGFINRLGNGDTLDFEYRLIGCFGGPSIGMRITRPYHYFVEQDGASALLSEDWLNVIRGLETSIAYEYGENQHQKGICNTIRTVTLKLNNETMVFTDRSCDWSGWDKLESHCENKNY